MIKNTESNKIEKGMWFSIGSPVITELASKFKFDWLLFDLEHGCLSEANLLQNLQAVGRTDIKLIVRVPELNASLIARVLDWGASGIMLPHVNTVEDAKECLKAMYYPPVGNRGYSSSSRSFKYGIQNANPKSPLFFAQIETIEGVENVDSIASLDGVDVLFVGPSDLKLNIKAKLNKSDIKDEYYNMLEKVGLAVKNNCKQGGILMKDMSEEKELTDLGFTVMSIASDLGILRDGLIYISETQDIVS